MPLKPTLKIFTAVNVVKFNILVLVLVFTLKYQLLYMKSVIIMNLTTLDFKNDCENGPSVNTGL